jgi:copper homeostasis protein (lipoprotein)
MAPATYRGTLPCADCSGVATTLTLWPDSLYRLRQHYTAGARDSVHLSMGRWRFDAGTLSLETDNGVPVLWERRGDDTLRLLDPSGRPVQSDQPHHVTRADSLDAIRDRGEWVGTFMLMADAPTFRECGSGATVPVLMTGGYRALEAAYRRAGLPAGSGWQVAVRGRFVPRPASMEGAGDVLEVARYVGPSINGNCR